jgi:leader peptidase (prepilin peptidase)/N-methyltransferase
MENSSCGWALGAEGLLLAWVLVLGALVGSFLNVVIARVPQGESIVHPRSRCPRCGKPIRWYDNIPILSFIILRARCRSCSAPISIRYPIVEALGAGAAYLAFARHGLSLAALAEFAFVASLLALAFIDLDTWLLPNAITWPLIAFGVVMSFLGLSAAASAKLSLYGAGTGFAFFGAVAVVGKKVFKKEALGLGDVWLLAGLGAWFGIGALLPVVLFASVQGSIVGIAMLLLGKNAGSRPVVTAGDDGWVPPPHAVPFGPFLVAGALEWLVLSGVIVRIVPMLEVFR